MPQPLRDLLKNSSPPPTVSARASWLNHGPAPFRSCEADLDRHCMALIQFLRQTYERAYVWLRVESWRSPRVGRLRQAASQGSLPAAPALQSTSSTLPKGLGLPECSIRPENCNNRRQSGRIPQTEPYTRRLRPP